MGDSLVHRSHEPNSGHLAGFVVDISSDNHSVIGEGGRFGGMPDGETHFDVHLQDNAADC